MNQKQRMLNGQLYIASDPQLSKEHKDALIKVYDYNNLHPAYRDELPLLLHDMLKKVGSSCWIEPPFHCDYGTNITLGNNVFINFNCTILDVCEVTIGNHVLIGPNVGIYTGTHPIDPNVRLTNYEFGLPIVIEDNVWIGGHSCILPGVTIGKNSVIGSGSVVNKDIPANSIAVGNPCKVIRKIDEHDRLYYAKDKTIDEFILEMIPSNSY